MPHPALPTFGWVHTLGRCSCWVAGRAALHLGQQIPIHQGFYSILLKCHVGTTALHSGSCLLFFFWKGLLSTSSKSAGTLSPQHYLQSGPNYTHYADEDALARRYAFARLRIRSGSVAGMGIKLGIVAMGSSPTTAWPWIHHVLPTSANLGSANLGSAAT